ncbi:hypothetical protein, partial [Novosphingobium umbonatum]|uniref:hypothetical protein n=1 Tax=Novosphingobium umbonatum TaxID=1908524 RepID=UPI001C6FE7D3
MDAPDDIPSNKQHGADSANLSPNGTPLVKVDLSDSWSTLAAEADLIDRWFGAEISKLFGD